MSRFKAYVKVLLTLHTHLLTPPSPAAPISTLMHRHYSPSAQSSPKSLMQLPPPGQQAAMEVKSWPGFFKAVGLQCPSRQYLTGWLRQCWKNSLTKKYHQKGMDFSQIQKSGVSKILLKVV